MDLEEMRRDCVDTVIRLREGTSGSLLCNEIGGGILGLADNLLAFQRLCCMELSCFFRHTVSMNFMLFMNMCSKTSQNKL